MSRAFLCRFLGHKWGAWRLVGAALWYQRDCWREGCPWSEKHSVWECANAGHTHP